MPKKKIIEREIYETDSEQDSKTEVEEDIVKPKSKKFVPKEKRSKEENEIIEQNKKDRTLNAAREKLKRADEREIERRALSLLEKKEQAKQEKEYLKNQFEQSVKNIILQTIHEKPEKEVKKKQVKEVQTKSKKETKPKRQVKKQTDTAYKAKEREVRQVTPKSNPLDEYRNLFM
jgi:hypothetical protein